MIRWLSIALYHSVLIVVVCLYIVPDGGTPADMGLAEFGWYSMFFTIYIANIKLVHSINIWFWWISLGMVFFSVLAFPLLYYIVGHGLDFVETEDAPFPLAALTNLNFWIGLLFITFLSLVPGTILFVFVFRFSLFFFSVFFSSHGCVFSFVLSLATVFASFFPV